SQRFFDLMGVDAPIVTDGILLPWQVDEVRGTIWIMAHERTEAFDAEDCRLMRLLADFAAMAVRNQRQQKKLMEQAKATAAAAMANELAHQINNPLQSLTNVVYLAAEGESGGDAKMLAADLSGDVRRLSGL
ncbi:MAG: GAF domain-containing protein, partial [Granulicella sp.]